MKFQNIAPANGRAFTADDVVWNIKRIATDKPEFQRRYMFENITSITAPDPATVVIKLDKPFAPLLAYLAQSIQWNGREGSCGGWEIFGPPFLGQVRFIYKEGQKGVSLSSSSATPDYWVKDRPYFDGMTISIVPDDGTRLAALRAGQIDIENPSADQAETFKSDKAFRYEESLQGGITALRYNASRPPFDDPRVRHAIDLVIDRPQLIDLLSNGKASITGAIPGRTYGMGNSGRRAC